VDDNTYEGGVVKSCDPFSNFWDDFSIFYTVATHFIFGVQINYGKSQLSDHKLHVGLFRKRLGPDVAIFLSSF